MQYNILHFVFRMSTKFPEIKAQSTRANQHIQSLIQNGNTSQHFPHLANRSRGTTFLSLVVSMFSKHETTANSSGSLDESRIRSGFGKVASRNATAIPDLHGATGHLFARSRNRFPTHFSAAALLQAEPL